MINAKKSRNRELSAAENVPRAEELERAQLLAGITRGEAALEKKKTVSYRLAKKRLARFLE